MTCIVGVIKDGVACLGGDSAVCLGSDMYARREGPKVFSNNGFLMGTSGLSRVSSVLRYKFKAPSFSLSGIGELREFMNTKFVDDLRQCLKENHCIKYGTEYDSIIGDTVALVAKNGRIFTIDISFSAIELVRPFTAIGSGSDFAIGFLHGIYDNDIDAHTLVANALKAASINAAVLEPFNIEISKP